MFKELDEILKLMSEIDVNCINLIYEFEFGNICFNMSTKEDAEVFANELINNDYNVNYDESRNKREVRVSFE